MQTAKFPDNSVEYTLVVQDCKTGPLDTKFYNDADSVLVILITSPSNCSEQFPFPTNYIEGIYRSNGFNNIIKVPQCKSIDDTVRHVQGAILKYVDLFSIKNSFWRTEKFLEELTFSISTQHYYVTSLGCIGYGTSIEGYFQPTYPVAYTTVDVIIYCPVTKKILLGYKNSIDQHCLIGGFVDPEKDLNYKDAALRELKEETGILGHFADTTFQQTVKIDDWRYQESRSKIFTNVFVVNVTKQALESAQPMDDLDMVTAVSVSYIKSDLFEEFNLISSHKAILKSFVDTLEDCEETSLTNK